MTLVEILVPVGAGGATHLALWTAGSTVLDRWGGAGTSEDRWQAAFRSVVVGFALLGSLALALGALHLLYRGALVALVAILAAAGLVRIARSRPALPRRPTLADIPALGAAAFVLVQLPRCVIPVLEHDENVYHLLLPKLYLAAHALTPLPWSLGANMPHLVDLAYVYPMALGGMTAAKVFVYGFLTWTLVGLAPFGRDMLGPSGPGVLAVLYLSGRVIQWHFGLAYVEPVIGALFLCAFQAFWSYRRDGRFRWLCVLALATGAACASKYTAWPMAAVLAVLCVVEVRKRGDRIGGRRLAVLGALLGLMLAPWLIKSALITRNPIFPNAGSLFPSPYWSAVQDAQFQHEMGYGRGADRHLATYLRLPVQLVSDPYTGILGGAPFSASLMLLLAISIAMPWRGRGDPASAARILTIAAFVFWCLGSKQGRYLVAFMPVMLIAAAAALMPLRRGRAGLPATVVAIALVATVQIRLQPYPKEPILDAFTVSRESLLARNLCWDLAGFLNRVVPESGRVLSFWENRLYFLDRPFIADSAYGAPTSLARLREAGDPHVFADRLRAEGITHVVINPYFWKAYMSNGFLYDMLDPDYYPPERLKADGALLDRFVRTELEEVPSDEGWAIFRLRASASARGGGEELSRDRVARFQVEDVPRVGFGRVEVSGG